MEIGQYEHLLQSAQTTEKEYTKFIKKSEWRFVRQRYGFTQGTDYSLFFLVFFFMFCICPLSFVFGIYLLPFFVLLEHQNHHVSRGRSEVFAEAN